MLQSLNIRYDLIGKDPSLDGIDILHVIDQWEAGVDRLVNGLLIDVCASHFYGLVSTDFERMSHLVDAIRSIEADAQFN